VGLSTIAAKFIAASEEAKELLGLEGLLGELGGQVSEVTTLYLDNTSAVKLAKNPEFHKRSKHVKARYSLYVLPGWSHGSGTH